MVPAAGTGRQPRGLAAQLAARAAHWVPPKRLSPRFAQMFDETTYAQVRADKYRCHFQYLMASHIPGAYDYFAITAGAQRLGDRFATQAGVEHFREFQLFGGDSSSRVNTAKRGQS